MPAPIPPSPLTRCLRGAVLLLSVVAGISILVMMTVTCAEVVLRGVTRLAAYLNITAMANTLHQWSKFLVGVYDIVQITGMVTIATGLPYTTAVKGHVAIEYFFQKMSRSGRIVVDTFCRVLTIALFSALTWQSIQYGLSLKQKGQVTLTLKLPEFWIPYVLAFSCGAMVLVTLYHLLRPGKELIKP